MWNMREKHGILPGIHTLVSLVALCSLATLAAQQKSSHSVRNLVSLSTRDRLQDTGWWPTKGVARRSEYVGTAKCAMCHSAKAASQISTEMAHASTRSPDPRLLEGQSALSFRRGSYDYEIVRRGDAVFESVSHGQSSLSRPLLFAFGQGIIGHTYIYQTGNTFYESRISYYSAIRGLDLTTGHTESQPDDLAQSLGRPLEPREVQQCFGCHTTASTTANHFEPSQSFEGVTCEGCHGPGSKHVQAMMAAQIERGKRSIMNPGKLDAASSVDFCGACHRTFGDVLQMGVGGVVTVRFQPFRLEKSRCWARAEGRLTCLTCHNPHEPMVQDIAYYDQICLRCHSRNVSGTAEFSPVSVTCKVGKTGCVNCHMPRIEIPGMHHAFSDHWIRITGNSNSYSQ